MRKKRFLDLDKFLNFHQEFIRVSTWTSDKRKKYNQLIEYMFSCEHCKITSSRDSDTTKVHSNNSFTIFKVPPTQRGNMKIYRDKWVLMYVIDRFAFQHFLRVFPLEKGIDKDYSIFLKNRLEFYYRDLC
jgi:hypothetical protein